MTKLSKPLAAFALVALTLAPVAANACASIGGGQRPAADAKATTGTSAKAVKERFAQWGPRQCCRRVGLQYWCGPC